MERQLLNDVDLLKYEKNSEIKILKGRIALSYEMYVDGDIPLTQYEEIKEDCLSKICVLETA